MTGDLAAAEVAQALGSRPVRSYPALLSTETAATAWARTGARAASVVGGRLSGLAARTRRSPVDRRGRTWSRLLAGPPPDLSPLREGWPYVAATLAVAEVLAEHTGVEWPDTVVALDGQGPLAQLGVYVELGPDRTEWVSLTVLVMEATPPRAPLLGQLLTSLEQRLADEADTVLEHYRPRCVTLSRDVRARMIRMGPGGPEVNGEAVDVIADGSLVVLTARGSRVAVPPQNLGLLVAPETPLQLPPEIARRLEDRS